jgi:hypothetical protein
MRKLLLLGLAAASFFMGFNLVACENHPKGHQNPAEAKT